MAQSACLPRQGGGQTASRRGDTPTVTGALDASGGLLTDPGDPDRPRGRADRSGTVTQTRSPPPRADQPAAALPAPDQVVAVPERRPAVHMAATASSRGGR